MNWSRIKTILICILLTTNLLLFLNLEANTPAEEKRKIDDIRQLYHSKGVTLAYEDIEVPSKVNGRVAELATITTEQEERIYQYFSNSDREYDFSVKDNTILCLWSKIPEREPLPAEKPGDAEAYIEKSRDFFRRISLDFEPSHSEFYSIDDILVAKVYQEVKHNIPEIESSIFLYFHGGEIVGLRLEKCLKLSSELGGSYDIISTADALYKALASTKAGDVLTDMRIVYKLNDESLLASDLVRGEMFPYFELKFKDSSALYIRATK